jgi:hypothetical protein
MAETWEQLAQECRKRSDANNDQGSLVIEFFSPIKAASSLRHAGITDASARKAPMASVTAKIS